MKSDRFRIIFHINILLSFAFGFASIVHLALVHSVYLTFLSFFFSYLRFGFSKVMLCRVVWVETVIELVSHIKVNPILTVINKHGQILFCLISSLICKFNQLIANLISY